VPTAPHRSTHCKKRPRRPLSGMLPNQHGSHHRWLPALDAPLDLIVTLDDATSEICSAFVVEEQGTTSTLEARRGDRRAGSARFVVAVHRSKAYAPTRSAVLCACVPIIMAGWNWTTSQSQTFYGVVKRLERAWSAQG
jgi:hypothetical protein